MFVPLTPLEFRRRAERLFGSKVGVIDGDARFTYAEFGDRSRRLAGALGRLEVKPGDVVSFLTHNTHHLLEAYFGVLQAGCVLNPLNIRLNSRELAYILNHVECRALFFHGDFAATVQEMRDRLETVRDLVVLEPAGPAPAADHEYETLLQRVPPLAADPEVDENSAAEIFYTSGTTGTPKGVVLTHRTLYLHALYAMVAQRTTDADVVLHVVPLFHVNGWGTPHYLTAVGGVHVLLRKVDPVEIFRLIERERVTKLAAVPAIYNALVNHPEAGRYDLSSLRLATSGGAPASPVLIKAIEERLGCEALVGYGLTETAPVVALARPKHHLGGEPSARQLERRSTTGYPILGVEVRVVDDRDRDVPSDGSAVGEIVVRSNVVMAGYLKDPQETAGAMYGGWFRTGDLATIDHEGYLNIVDRKKDIIISGGENISSVEVENALVAHPAVYECAVVAVPDARWGEVPKALVVLKPPTSATEQELITFCRERLAHFKAPASVEFLDALPKSGTNKVLKAALRARYWAGHAKRVN
jgi:fatty-acyl-CoA synthase